MDELQAKQAMLDQMAVSMMTQQLLFNIATIHIAVLTELTLLDQDIILALEERLINKGMQPNQPPPLLIVIHNHMRAKTDEELRGLIDNHIANFNADVDIIDGAQVFFSTRNNLTTWHVPLADNTTEFGAKFNRAQFQFIRTKIKMTKRSGKVGFWQHLQKSLSETLKTFSVDRQVIEGRSPEVEICHFPDRKNEYDQISELNFKTPDWKSLRAKKMKRIQNPKALEAMMSILPKEFIPAEIRLEKSEAFGTTQNLSLSFMTFAPQHEIVADDDGVAFVLSLPNLSSYFIPEYNVKTDRVLKLMGIIGKEVDGKYQCEFPFGESGAMRPYPPQNRKVGNFTHTISLTQPEFPFGYNPAKFGSWYEQGILTIYFPALGNDVPKARPQNYRNFMKDDGNISTDSAASPSSSSSSGSATLMPVDTNK